MQLHKTNGITVYDSRNDDFIRWMYTRSIMGRDARRLLCGTRRARHLIDNNTWTTRYNKDDTPFKGQSCCIFYKTEQSKSTWSRLWLKIVLYIFVIYINIGSDIFFFFFVFRESASRDFENNPIRVRKKRKR